MPVFPLPAEWEASAHDAGGFHDATTDIGRVEAWWSRTPEANLGVPTGAVSGMVVVDVDVHGPVDGRQAFARAERAGLVDGWGGLLVETPPTGGLHAYFAATVGGRAAVMAGRSRGGGLPGVMAATSSCRPRFASSAVSRSATRSPTSATSLPPRWTRVGCGTSSIHAPPDQCGRVVGWCGWRI